MVMLLLCLLRVKEFNTFFIKKETVNISTRRITIDAPEAIFSRYEINRPATVEIIPTTTEPTINFFIL